MGFRERARGWLFAIERWVFYRLLRGRKQRRVQVFWEMLRPAAGERLLDVGAGAGDFWKEFARGRDGKTPTLQMAGIDLKPIHDFSVFQWRLVADARHLPFKDGSFDMVFSNSVIEHVGDFPEQARMAAEIQRVGRRFFVQVPAKSFPIEAHYFIPFLSYLPVRWQVALTKQLFGISEPIHLPTLKVARTLFPNAKIETEKMFGLTKSFLIYRS